jgi:HK97 family phage prohead protease
MEKFDFSGWATKANLKCSDGRVIMKDAFKHHDGQKVPLVWNHRHDDPENVLGHAILENREEGVYAYCKFNDTLEGQRAKTLVQHGDVTSLSIYANQLKQQGANVIHGMIRELSLVLAGANPGACIDSVMVHGEASEEEGDIYTGEPIEVLNSEEVIEEVVTEEVVTEENTDMAHADGSNNEGDTKMENENKNAPQAEGSEKTVQEVFDELTEEQKTVVYAIIGQVIEDQENESNGGNEQMKHNVFDQDNTNNANVLTHSDEQAILALARSNGVGSFQDALNIYLENNQSLAHGFEDVEELFPDYKDVKSGAPEMITRDLTWVDAVINKTHKSPVSRIRTRQADVTGADLNALGYEKGKQKKNGGNIKLIKRTTDPQTVYRKDFLNRDDIVDITDFDVVEYQYKVMKQNLYEEIAKAIMIGDGREDGDADKISEDHIRSIWHDDELYTIHADVDIAAAKAELQGSNTSANFGENYIYAEAIITAALYAREKYKGSGSLEFYCTPHLLNVMLLARDLNGRRIYDSKADLAAALNVSAIHTVEQFEGKTRTTKEGATKKLLGLFVNLGDYQVGCTKGGEITKFNQFDIDFNQEKYLIETRISGALTKIKSAIALEEPEGAASTAEDEEV